MTPRWFKVPFSSPSWRSLNPWKGHLTIPKRSLRITRSWQFHSYLLFSPREWGMHFFQVDYWFFRIVHSERVAKKKRQEKNEPRFGVLQFATQLSKLEYCSCVMSWPSMVYDLAIAKRSGAFVKKWGGSKNRGDVSRVSRWFPGNTKLKGVVNYIMNRRKFTPNGILEEVKDVFVGISLNSDEWFLGVKIHTMWWYDYLKLLLTL